MINLIPSAAKKSITTEYWLRVVTSWFLVWSAALVVGVFALVPSYVLINIQVSVYEESAKMAQESIDNFQAVSKELVASSRQAGLVMNDVERPVLYDYVTLFESLQNSGIVISEVRLMRSTEGVDPVYVAGEAKDRESLAAFRDRILSQPTVKEVDLPISNLAKDRDIQFGLTVTMHNNVAL